MSIDTGIYNALLRQPKIESPMEAQAKAESLRGIVGQNRLADMAFGEKRQAIQRQNNLLQLTQGLGADATDDQRISAFKGGGFFDEADRLEKGMLERQKVGATVNETNQKIFRTTVGLIAADPRPETVEAILTDLEKTTGRSSATARQMFATAGGDPARISEIAKRIALEIEKQLPKTQTNNTGGSTITQGIDPVTGKATTISTIANTASPDAVMGDARMRSEGAAGRAVTMRGQNMTDARARETLAAGGKAPAGYRWSADGTKMEAIPGGPAEKDKAPTEFQGKSAGFGARAEEADKILGALEGKGVTNTGIIRSVAQGAGEMIPFMGDKVGAAIGSGMNTLPGFLGGPSGDQQRVDQARRDFVNAVLRQESGAAIAQSEFDNASRQYFPQPGDTPEVIAQKGRNRKLAIQGFKNNAGKAGFTAPAQQNVFSQADAILKGK